MFFSNKFLSVLNTCSLYKIIDDLEIENEQLGKKVDFLDKNDLPTSDKKYDIAILGINDLFGSELKVKYHTQDNNVDLIRKNLYFLYTWYEDIHILDLGNLIKSKYIEIAYDKIKSVNDFCLENNIKLIVLGGPHNLLVGNIESFKKNNLEFNFTNIDALVDINSNKRFQEYLFLDSIFSNKKFGLNTYNHIGFQSYYTHPQILSILNNTNYHFYRLGFIKDNMFEIEPDIRTSHLVSLDMVSVEKNKSGINKMPNGFSGEEMCLLSRFCGMFEILNCFGIYGYYSFMDDDNQVAALISQMIWYFIEGLHYKKNEGNKNSNLYNMFITSLNDIKTIFYQHKITLRWWMQHQDKDNLVPCSYKDYVSLTKGEVPDRWIKSFKQ